MLSLFYIVQIPFCSFYIRTYSGVPFAPPYFVSGCGFARLRRANPQPLTKSNEAPKVLSRGCRGTAVPLPEREVSSQQSPFLSAPADGMRGLPE